MLVSPYLIGEIFEQAFEIDVKAGLHCLEPPKDVDEVGRRDLGCVDRLDQDGRVVTSEVGSAERASAWSIRFGPDLR